MIWNAAVLAVLLSSQPSETDFDEYRFQIAIKSRNFVYAVRPHCTQFPNQEEWMKYRFAEQRFTAPIKYWQRERAKEGDKKMRAAIEEMMSAGHK
ncbi:hypothetical protein [Rhodopirellula bahusiensis]|uniref:hypothetical protein n=1 Tax=Rhodopirellula bahusiensis TaxID=2014065 RepID=UPI00326449C4